MFSEVDEQRLVRAIANAERDNRGEVRLHVEARCPVDDPQLRARALYRQQALHRTRDDTAVLLYVAEASRVAAVHAGQGIHGCAEADFWQSVTEAVAGGYRDGRPVDGPVAALDRVGALLREHAAGDDVAGNELPDEVTYGTDASSS